MRRLEPFDVGPVSNDVNLSGWELLNIAEICAICFRHCDVAIYEATHDAVDEEAAFQPSVSPMLAQVRRFHDDGNSTEPPNGRGQQARIK